MYSIFLVDDEELELEMIRDYIRWEEMGIYVAGTAINGKDAMEKIQVIQPDIVLTDVQMPIMNGISALKRIKQIRPDIFILILTTFIETDYIVEGMAFGASGYMLKDMDADKMISSIRDTISGQFILPAPVAAKLATRMNRLTEYEHWQRSNVDRMSLTEREEELAQLIIRGLNNREIADTLHIAEGTARNYISNLYSKLEVVDRAQAIVRLQAIMQP